jgi:choline dehydrogenase-like flavoprotein
LEIFFKANASLSVAPRSSGQRSRGDAAAGPKVNVTLGVMFAGPETAKQYSYPEGNLVDTGGWGFSIGLIQPQSRGRIILRDIDPTSKPVLDLRYFSDPADKETMVRSIEFCREMGHAKSMQREVSASVRDCGCRQLIACADGGRKHGRG